VIDRHVRFGESLLFAKLHCIHTFLVRPRAHPADVSEYFCGVFPHLSDEIGSSPRVERHLLLSWAERYGVNPGPTASRGKTREACDRE
jgi:hypothetical protein